MKNRFYVRQCASSERKRNNKIMSNKHQIGKFFEKDGKWYEATEDGFVEVGKPPPIFFKESILTLKQLKI